MRARARSGRAAPRRRRSGPSAGRRGPLSDQAGRRRAGHGHGRHLRRRPRRARGGGAVPQGAATREWREAPMAPLDNDRVAGPTFDVESIGALRVHRRGLDRSVRDLAAGPVKKVDARAGRRERAARGQRARCARPRPGARHARRSSRPDRGTSWQTPRCLPPGRVEPRRCARSSRR